MAPCEHQVHHMVDGETRRTTGACSGWREASVVSEAVVLPPAFQRTQLTTLCAALTSNPSATLTTGTTRQSLGITHWRRAEASRFSSNAVLTLRTGPHHTQQRREQLLLVCVQCLHLQEPAERDGGVGRHSWQHVMDERGHFPNCCCTFRGAFQPAARHNAG